MLPAINYSLPAFSNGSRSWKARQYSETKSSFTEGQDARIVLSSRPRTFYSEVKCAGRLVFTRKAGTSADAPADAAKSRIIGSAMSIIRDYAMYMNNVPITQINNVNIINNMMMNLSCSPSARMNSTALTSDQLGRSVAGVDVYLNDTNKNLTFDFSFPLPAAASSQQSLCAQDTNYEFVFKFENLAEFIQNYDTTKSELNGYTVNDFRLEYDCLELDPTSWGSWKGLNISEKNELTYSCSTFMYSSYTLPSGTSGSVQLPLGSRPRSCRALLIAIQPSNIITGKFGAVHANTDRLTALINGQQFPMIPLNSENDPLSVMAHTQDIIGGANGTKANCLTMDNWCVSSTKGPRTRPYTPKGTAPSEHNWDSLFVEQTVYQYISLEDHQQDSVLSGQDVGSAILELNIVRALSAVPHFVHVFFLCDQKIVHNFTNNLITNVQ